MSDPNNDEQEKCDMINVDTPHHGVNKAAANWWQGLTSYLHNSLRRISHLVTVVLPAVESLQIIYFYGEKTVAKELPIEFY